MNVDDFLKEYEKIKKDKTPQKKTDEKKSMSVDDFLKQYQQIKQEQPAQAVQSSQSMPIFKTLEEAQNYAKENNINVQWPDTIPTRPTLYNKEKQTLYTPEKEQKKSLVEAGKDLTNKYYDSLLIKPNKDLKLSEIAKVPESWKDNNRRFEDGYQFGDFTKTGFENAKEFVQAVGSTAAEIPLRAGREFLGVAENASNFIASRIADVNDLQAALVSKIPGTEKYTETLKSLTNNLRKEVAKGSPWSEQDKWVEDIADYLDRDSFTGKTADTVAGGLGQIAAYTAVGSVLGDLGNVEINIGNRVLKAPIVAFLTGGGSQDVKNYQMAEQQLGGIENATGLEKAIMSFRSILGGGIEAFSEGMFGMFGVGGNEITDQWRNQAIAKANTAFEKWLASFVVAGGGEGIEECASYVGNYVVDKILDALNKKAGGRLDFSTEFNWEEMLGEAFSAFLSSGISMGGSSAIRINNITKVNQQLYEYQTGKQLNKTQLEQVRKAVADQVLKARSELDDLKKMYPAEARKIDLKNTQENLKTNGIEDNRITTELDNMNKTKTLSDIMASTDFSHNFSMETEKPYTPSGIANIVRNKVEKKVGDDIEIEDVYVQDGGVIVEYEGNMTESELFDKLNEEPIIIDGVKINVQPMTTGHREFLDEMKRAMDKAQQNTVESQANVPSSQIDTQNAQNTIQGLEEYSEDELKNMIADHVEQVTEGNVKLKDVSIQDGKATITYDSDLTEELMEQALNTEPLNIDGVEVRITPVKHFNQNYSNKEIQNVTSDKISIATSENDIRKFVDNAKSASNNLKIYIGKIADNISQKIKDTLGFDVKGYNISIKNDAVRKILKDHGKEETELPRGQVPITENDFLQIPNIINNPDKITDGGNNVHGKPTLQFEKNLNGNTVVVTYVSDKHNNLELQTMYKFKNNKKTDSSTALHESYSPGLDTSKTDSSTSLVNNNIPQNKQNVNNSQNVENTADVDDDDLPFEPRAPYTTETKNDQQTPKVQSVKEGKYEKQKSNKPVVKGHRIWEGFQETGYIDLTGQKIESFKDVADLAQIFRNPLYETLRILYIKDGKVVGMEAITSKTAGLIKIELDTKLIEKVKDRMKRLGADGYYMIHNHPSGNAVASDGDIEATSMWRSHVPGFQGHVIVDHGTYAFIDPNMYVFYDFKVDSSNSSYHGSQFQTALKSNKVPWNNMKVNSREDVAALGHHVKNSKDYSCLILTDPQNKVNAIIDVPNKFFNMSKEQVEGYIRNVSKRYGASEAFLGTYDESTFKKMKNLDNIVDIVWIDSLFEKETGVPVRMKKNHDVFNDKTTKTIRLQEEKAPYNANSNPVVRTVNQEALQKLAKELNTSDNYIEANVGKTIGSAKNFLITGTNIVDNYMKEKNITFPKKYKKVELSRVKNEKMQKFVKDNNLTVEKLANNEKLLDTFLDMFFEDYIEEAPTEEAKKYLEETKGKWKTLFESVKDTGNIPSALKVYEREFDYINKGITEVEDDSQDWYNRRDIINSKEFNDYIDKKLEGLFDETTYETEDVMEEAKRNHGTTNDYSRGAYMTTDGELLYFDYGGFRDDHRNINAYDMSMSDFMRYGAIRMQPEGRGFELATEPTEAQYKRLADYIDNYLAGDEVNVDIDVGAKDIYDTATYKANTPSDVILDDIRYYFENGHFPNKSKYAEFMEPRATYDINDGFYSQVEKVISTKMANKADAQTIKNLLNKNGAKQDELDWLDMDNFLASKDTFTKQEVLDYIKANQMYLEEVVKSNQEKKKAEARLEEIYKRQEEIADEIDEIVKSYNITDYTGRGTLGYPTYNREILERYDEISDSDRNKMEELLDEYEELEEEAGDIDEEAEGVDDTRYEKYTTDLNNGAVDKNYPSGNYREVLFTLPNNRYVGDENGENPQLVNKKLKGIDYTSPHWYNNNVIAHTRLQDYTDENKNKVLFIEEIQSDLHQTGRNKGYSDSSKDNHEKIEELNKQYDDLRQEINRKENEMFEKAQKNTRNTLKDKKKEER